MKNFKKNSLLTGALAAGALLSTANTEAENMLSFDFLGTGGELRSQLLSNEYVNLLKPSENSIKTIEAACGEKKAEAKSSDAKCGEAKAEAKAKDAKCGEAKAKDAKCGEGKCGEAKAEAKSKDAKCGEAKAKDAKCGEGKCGEGKCGENKK